MKVITWFYSNSELIIKIIGNENENGDKDSSSGESSEEEDYESGEEFEIGEQVSVWHVCKIACIRGNGCKI